MALNDEEKLALAQAQEDESKRADSEQEDEDRRTILASALAKKLEAEGGKRGVDFAIVNNHHGVFAIRKPDTQAVRNWERASDEKRNNLEWLIGILRHYIVPPETQTAWCQVGSSGRPGLVWHTASQFVDLMGVDRSLTKKK